MTKSGQSSRWTGTGMAADSVVRRGSAAAAGARFDSVGVHEVHGDAQSRRARSTAV